MLKYFYGILLNNEIFDKISLCNKYIIKWSGSEDSSQYNLCLCAHFLIYKYVSRGTFYYRGILWIINILKNV